MYLSSKSWAENKTCQNNNCIPSASGRSNGRNKFLVTIASMAMLDHVNLEFIPNSGKPLRIGVCRYKNKLNQKVMWDHIYKQNMALKMKLPPVAWTNSATAAPPWAGPWSVGGQGRKFVFWRRVDRGSRPRGALPGRPGWPPAPRKRLKVNFLLVISHVEWLEPVDCDSDCEPPDKT